MNFTQNEKLNQVSEQSIVVGVDIASETHYARAFDWRGVELGKVFKFENSTEGFQSFSKWVDFLKEKINYKRAGSQHYILHQSNDSV